MCKQNTTTHSWVGCALSICSSRKKKPEHVWFPPLPKSRTTLTPLLEQSLIRQRRHYLMESVFEQECQEFNHRELGIGLNPPQMDVHEETQKVSKLLYVTTGKRQERNPLRAHQYCQKKMH